MNQQSVTIPNNSPESFTILLRNVIKSNEVQFESLIRWISRTTFKSSTTYHDKYRDFFHPSQYLNGLNSNFLSSIEILYIDDNHTSVKIEWDNGQEAIIIGIL